MKKWLCILLALALALSAALAGLAESDEADSGASSEKAPSESSVKPAPESKPKSDPAPSKPASDGASEASDKPSSDGGGSGSSDKPSSDGGASGSSDKPSSDGGASGSSDKPSSDGGSADAGSSDAGSGGSDSGDAAPTAQPFDGTGGTDASDGGLPDAPDPPSGTDGAEDGGNADDGPGDIPSDNPASGDGATDGPADSDDPSGDGGDGNAPEVPGDVDPEDPDDGDAPVEALTPEQVLQVQTWLSKLGYLTASQITGVYDDATRDAVMRFQADNGLPATGECGASTLALLAQKAGEADGEDEAPDETPDGAPGGTPGRFPRGRGGFRGWGGRRSRAYSGGVGGMGRTDEAGDDALNGITPGQALTSSHSRGDKDTCLYGSVASLEELNIALYAGDDANDLAPAEIVDALAEETHLFLDGGDSAVQRWTLDGLTLRTLSRSGIDALTLSGEGGSVTLATSGLLSGAVYTALRARGRTDNTFEYTVLLAGAEPRIAASVDGVAYEAVAMGDALELIDSSDGGAGR